MDGLHQNHNTSEQGRLKLIQQHARNYVLTLSSFAHFEIARKNQFEM